MMKKILMVLLLGFTSLVFASNGEPVRVDPISGKSTPINILESAQKYTLTVTSSCPCTDGDYEQVVADCYNINISTVSVVFKNTSFVKLRIYDLCCPEAFVWLTLGQCVPQMECCTKVTLYDNAQLVQPVCVVDLPCIP